jgi:CBS domain-containing protein
MHIHGEAQVLRIYIGESERHEGRLLHEAIVEEARGRGMAGATVFRGIMGFGANSLVHTAKILRLSEDLPMVVEIVDKAARIEAFLPRLEGMVTEGVITRHTVQALFHCPMKVRDIMRAEVFSVEPDTPLEEVLDLLLGRGIKAVPVIEGGKAVGMITGGDLLSRAGMGLRLSLHEVLPRQMRDEERQKLALQGKTARDVMSAPALTVNIRARVPEVAGIMARRELKRLIVVDDTGEVAGIVSRIDILRTIATAVAVADDIPPELPRGLKLTARDVMHGDVPTVLPHTSLQETLDKVVATPLRRVVVLDEADRVVGIVLDRDLIRRLHEQGKEGLLRGLGNLLGARPTEIQPLEGTAGEVMHPEVYTVRADASLSRVLERMLETGGKRLVVLDPEGRLCGMVDRDRILGIIGGLR